MRLHLLVLRMAVLSLAVMAMACASTSARRYESLTPGTVLVYDIVEENEHRELTSEVLPSESFGGRTVVPMLDTVDGKALRARLRLIDDEQIALVGSRSYMTTPPQDIAFDPPLVVLRGPVQSGTRWLDSSIHSMRFPDVVIPTSCTIVDVDVTQDSRVGAHQGCVRVGCTGSTTADDDIAISFELENVLCPGLGIVKGFARERALASGEEEQLGSNVFFSSTELLSTRSSAGAKE